MIHPLLCDHAMPWWAWWPVSRVTGHHGLTGETWQRLTLGDGGWWDVSRAAPSPGQARPTRLPEARLSIARRVAGVQRPGSNVSLSPMASAPASCSRKHGHTQASHWSDCTATGLWLADDDLPRPLGLPASVSPVSPVTCHTLTCVTDTRGWLWLSRHSSNAWRHTQQLPLQIFSLRMLIITNYPGLRGSTSHSRGHQDFTVQSHQYTWNTRHSLKHQKKAGCQKLRMP